MFASLVVWYKDNAKWKVEKPHAPVLVSGLFQICKEERMHSYTMAVGRLTADGKDVVMSVADFVFEMANEELVHRRRGNLVHGCS